MRNRCARQRAPAVLRSSRVEPGRAGSSRVEPRGGSMEFRILGPLEIVEHGRLLPAGGEKQRTMLALLLLHHGEVVAATRLIDALWGEEPPETAATALHGHVSRLRKLLPREALLTRAPGYLLRIEAGA